MISIHAPRVGSDGDESVFTVLLSISIHAPRVGSDAFQCLTGMNMPISIHAPRVGSDMETVLSLARALGFQSTLPVWGATACRDLFVRIT